MVKGGALIPSLCALRHAAHALLRPKGWAAAEIDSETLVDSDGADFRIPATTTPYRPNSFLSAALPALALHACDAPGLAVDLGCGSGRDAVFMAETLAARAPQWSVLGIDNHAAALGSRPVTRPAHRPPTSASAATVAVAAARAS